MERLERLLSQRGTRHLLLSLHMLMMVAAFAVFGKQPSGDQATYLGLAEGLERGAFSYWHGILEQPPIETYRTHGYPAFLWLVRRFAQDTTAVRVAQSVLHLLTLLLLLRWAGRRPDGLLRQNVLLLLLLPQFQLLHYAHEILPETLMAFLCTAIALTGMGTPGMRRAVLLGLLIAAGFWVRPVLLLFPLFVLLADLLLARGAERITMLRGHTITLVVFLLAAPLPFGLWNLRTHGVFKPVPISGSAVVSDLGFWQHRLPGYGSMRYFHYNFFGREILPWVDDDAAARWYTIYNAQWDRIEAAAEPFMSEADRRDIPIMDAGHKDLFITRSAGITLALDSIIRREMMANIQAEPGYYLATRCYTAIRLWITNINRPMAHWVFTPDAGDRPLVGWPAGPGGWVAMLAPFLITAVTFGLGGLFLLWRILRDRRSWHERRYALLLIAYLWMIHIPMVIQSRYLVPVHALVVASIAMAWVEWRAGRTSA
ncbi:MAG: hypothetical protein KIT10_00140 [Flavobacteriales bacterium]|nr:hypothetical protein [Flavobacteriales bacterium]